MKIKLKRSWKNLPAGAVIELGQSVADELIETGTAKPAEAPRPATRNKSRSKPSKVGGQS